VERAVAKAERDEPLTGADYVHTRYTLEGCEGDDAGWPNFQLDGLGTWLWALAEHARLAGLEKIPPDWREAATLTARFLAALWSRPCYDCWEEFQNWVHPYTLAAIYGGLRAMISLGPDGEWTSIPPLIQAFVLEQGVHAGRLVKSIGNPIVDASLLGVATPYRLLEPDDPLMQATVARIEAELRREGGGVHRYAADTYYGGGEWILLTAWLGWYYAEAGEVKRASEILPWVEAQADERGNLPEQLPRTLVDPRCLEIWREQRGEIANPLVWSHAKYIILQHHLSGLT
jgi:GH15 family glucan-1,4-alpha-glucosidase